MKMIVTLALPLLILQGCGDSGDDSQEQTINEATDLTSNDSISIDATAEDAWIYLDLDQDTLAVDEAGPWDIAIQRYRIKLNQASTPPTAAAILEGSIGSVSSPGRDAFQVDQEAEKPEDGYVFNGEDAWYDYDINSHVLTPKPSRVYVVYTTDHQLYGMSFLGYYDNVGTPAHVSFQIQKIEP
ncbi:HmuY family protein [Pseudobacteriovorax antillogorgiicola]|uniref:HmuY protein n=1 Tax=Pseudobacteriovorax antillogorgiicola TaxID=1513793 RepID=A0A1Y6CA63_9BACT|nr:HmuY family protein [Pseudobacteriovorax antillogorgiicola]TCS49029.1 heme-binding HmuY-like protein [Pseudobacteriovorax antillogorgiicola]SMF52775.1 HmuY protein [Pseudobacteriovorax antillogorgiicola]